MPNPELDTGRDPENNNPWILCRASVYRVTQETGEKTNISHAYIVNSEKREWLASQGQSCYILIMKDKDAESTKWRAF